MIIMQRVVIQMSDYEVYQLPFASTLFIFDNQTSNLVQILYAYIPVSYTHLDVYKRQIENLNVSGMMKNSHLSKAVASQKFYEFRTKLKAKCDENGIELRVVDRWYPSSKICHCCGAIKKDLKLSDRIYRCDCGYVEDRDFNAALNLRDALTYEVA